MIFRREHLELIIAKVKTQTRRLGARRWRVGALHSARTNYYEKGQHYIRIDAVRRESLNRISVADAQAEGGYTPSAFIQGFCEMHAKRGCTPDSLVWVVTFHYAGCKPTDEVPERG